MENINLRELNITIIREIKCKNTVATELQQKLRVKQISNTLASRLLSHVGVVDISKRYKCLFN